MFVLCCISTTGSHMACFLFCTKPLTEPIMTSCQLKHNLMKYELKYIYKIQKYKIIFCSAKCIWKCCLQYVGHFVKVSVCKIRSMIFDHILIWILLFMLYLLSVLTHWGRMMHICVSTLTIIGSDNRLSPGRRQTIIWTNAGILLIRPAGTNFSKILMEIYTFSFNKVPSKMSSGKCRSFCLGLNEHSMKPLEQGQTMSSYSSPIQWRITNSVISPGVNASQSTECHGYCKAPPSNDAWNWNVVLGYRLLQCSHLINEP